MPQGDRTGPAGQGPMTGRGLGFCAGNDSPGFTQPGIGFRGGGRFRAPRMGRGFGRGFAWRAQPQQQAVQETKANEREMLEQELASIKQEQKEIEQRLKELK
ncbi:MAG: DUF5320 domain-containing protein [Candidatus Nanoarchaeia archaeon]